MPHSLLLSWKLASIANWSMYIHLLNVCQQQVEWFYMDNTAYALLAGASSHLGGRLILGRGQAWHGMAMQGCSDGDWAGGSCYTIMVHGCNPYTNIPETIYHNLHSSSLTSLAPLIPYIHPGICCDDPAMFVKVHPSQKHGWVPLHFSIIISNPPNLHTALPSVIELWYQSLLALAMGGHHPSHQGWGLTLVMNCL